MNNSECANFSDTSSRKSQEDKNIDHLTKWLAVTELIGIIVFNTVVLVLLLFPKKSSRMAFFVRNLALADLCVGLIYLLPEIIVYKYHVGWNKPSCIFFFSIRMFPVYASTFAIVILTLDRLYVVIRPIESATKGIRYKIVPLVLSWLLALLLLTPYCILVTFKEGKCYYFIKGTGAKVMLLYDIAVNVVIPISIIGLCYAIIVMTIFRRQRHKLLIQSNPLQKHQYSVTTTESLLTGKSDFFTKAKIKTIKLLFVVIAAYVICWTPVCIGDILLTWGVIKNGPVYKVLLTLAPLNSLVNPLVFLLFNTQTFRFKSSLSRRNLTVSRSTSFTNRLQTSVNNGEYLTTF